MKIILVTTRHLVYDTRIYQKYFRSLRNEFDVSLFALNQNDVCEKNIKIFNGRFQLLLSLIKEKKSVIHFHDPDFLPFAYILKTITNHILIYDVHEDVPNDIYYKIWIPKFFRIILSYSVKRIENFVSKRIDAVVCATDHICNRFIQMNSNCIAVKNYPLVKELDFELIWNNKSNKYSYVGSLSENRSIDLMLNLATAMPMLNLAGSFSDRELEKRITSSNKWKHVTFFGIVNENERDNILEESIVGIVILKPIITFEKALSVKLFEYMERGIPVICSNFQVNKDIIEKHECGFCVDPLNKEQILEKLTFLMENKNIAKKLGSNGRNAVKKFFSWENEYMKLEKLYRDVRNCR